jgi:PAN domain
MAIGIGRRGSIAGFGGAPRAWRLAAIILALLTAVSAHANTLAPSVGTLANGVDLTGGDYSNFWAASAEPQLCQAACRADAKCAAWTYVKPGVQGPQARCWLKSQVPQATQNECCTSGVERAVGNAVNSVSGPAKPGAQCANPATIQDPSSCYACNTNIFSGTPLVWFNGVCTQPQCTDAFALSNAPNACAACGFTFYPAGKFISSNLCLGPPGVVSGGTFPGAPPPNPQCKNAAAIQDACTCDSCLGFVWADGACSPAQCSNPYALRNDGNACSACGGTFYAGNPPGNPSFCQPRVSPTSPTSSAPLTTPPSCFQCTNPAAINNASSCAACAGFSWSNGACTGIPAPVPPPAPSGQAVAQCVNPAVINNESSCAACAGFSWSNGVCVGIPALSAQPTPLAPVLTKQPTCGAGETPGPNGCQKSEGQTTACPPDEVHTDRGCVKQETTTPKTTVTTPLAPKIKLPPPPPKAIVTTPKLNVLRPPPPTLKLPSQPVDKQKR